MSVTRIACTRTWLVFARARPRNKLAPPELASFPFSLSFFIAIFIPSIHFLYFFSINIVSLQISNSVFISPTLSSILVLFFFKQFFCYPLLHSISIVYTFLLLLLMYMCGVPPIAQLPLTRRVLRVLTRSSICR